METKLNNKEVFKYNMGLYYQSTIIYFIVFVFYIVIRGQFAGGGFQLVIDPIIYFFALILVLAFLSILYNLYLNKKLIVDENSISFTDRRKNRVYNISDIISIKIGKAKPFFNNSAFKFIRIRFKNKSFLLIIRPQDYEKQTELVNRFIALKAKIENKNV